jgi:malate dehydrogenase (oxaloacetate-decarboxylating)(NADP+)
MPIPGKYTVAPIKKLSNRHDLAMTHTPGVVGPCNEIAKNPEVAFMYTNKARTIGLFSNGTSVLGLGNLGALASKPDLEGKAALYKRFSGVDCVDVCVDTPDSETFINVVKVMSPSFGAINLENIKAPDCFEIEATLKKQMPIPVFHNDQHGTAVVVLAALHNALEIKGKSLDTVKIVCNGAGAAGIACMDLLI